MTVVILSWRVSDKERREGVIEKERKKESERERERDRER